jgi:hypothetical protein
MESEALSSLQVKQLVAEAMSAIVTRIILRRDEAANWLAADAVLGDGELGFETDSRLLKIGDGSTPWPDLDYLGNVIWGTPTSASAPGTRGMCMYDANYAYFCVADSTWKRTALSTW